MGQRLVEIEEIPLGRPLVRGGALEPVVRDAAVVHGEVTDKLEPATVCGAHERRKRLVAAEQRVDVVERRGVVAVRAAGREERRQVDDVRTECPRCGRGAARRRRGRRRTTRAACSVRGLRAARPIRGVRPTVARSVQPRSTRNGRERSRRRRSSRATPVRRDRARAEVVGAGDLGAREATPVQPCVAGVAARKQPAVRDRQVLHGQIRAPPGLVAGLLVDDRGHRSRLAVVREAEQHLVGGAVRDAHAKNCLASELVRPLGDVELGAVMVRLRKCGAAHRFRRGHPFTAPWVSPPISHFCSDMKSAAAGIAASSVPAANGPQRWPYCWSMKPFMPTASVK